MNKKDAIQAQSVIRLVIQADSRESAFRMSKDQIGRGASSDPSWGLPDSLTLGSLSQALPLMRRELRRGDAEAEGFKHPVPRPLHLVRKGSR